MHTRNNHQRRGIKINISVKKLTELGEMAVKNGCYYCLEPNLTLGTAKVKLESLLQMP